MIKSAVINNLRYADDTVLLTDITERLQGLIDQVHNISKKLRMKFVSKQTKIVIIFKNQDTDARFMADNDVLERTDKMTYIGSSPGNTNVKLIVR